MYFAVIAAAWGFWWAVKEALRGARYWEGENWERDIFGVLGF